MRTERLRTLRQERRKFWGVSDRKWLRTHPRQGCLTEWGHRYEDMQGRLDEAIWRGNAAYPYEGLIAWTPANSPGVVFFGVDRCAP